MATPIQQLKIFGKTAGASLTVPLQGLSNISIANAFRNLGGWFESIGIGSRSFNGTVLSNGVQASGTVTISSMVANDTVTINGVVYTCVNSGATAGQFNKGTTDTLTAANLAAAINAETRANAVTNVVSATSASTVVTVTCKEQGQIGNLCTLAISAHGSVSAANLASGTDGTVVNLAKGI